MKTTRVVFPWRLLAAGLLAFLTINAPAAVLCVDVNGTNATPPYSDWSTAATNINDAIDAASNGDTVLVTNGVYQTGGRTVNGFALTNRVAVTKPLTLQSVNGPAVTIIKGYQMPGTIKGNCAVRCVYLTNGALLAGFTLTNGATQDSGGSPQSGRQYSGGGVWCESVNAAVSNCVLFGNSGEIGGGAYSGTLNNCTLTSNSVIAIVPVQPQGGGAAWATLNNCTLTGNSAEGGGGGGAYSGTLSNCTLTGNSAPGGGGAASATLNNCLVVDNSARSGGGVGHCTLNNCLVCSNSAYEYHRGPGFFWRRSVYVHTQQLHNYL